MAELNDFTIPVLSDYHVHLRQGIMTKQVADWSGRCCGVVMAMPNTDPPIDTVDHAKQYIGAIKPLMPDTHVLVAMMLNESTTLHTVRESAPWRNIPAFKLYPAGATHNSVHGVSVEILRKPYASAWLFEILQEMEAANKVLCLHGEMPDQSNPLRREIDFLPFITWVTRNFPKLRVVLEHITTAQAVKYVESGPPTLAATITAHHLFLHLGHIFGCAVDDDLGYTDGKLHPHNFCWPIAKGVNDRDSLVSVVLAGHPRFFLGSDSAPHEIDRKEHACGCAGVFSAYVLPEVLAEFFSRYDATDKMADFTSQFGNKFYGMSASGRQIRMVRSPWTVPERIWPTPPWITPFLAGRLLNWRTEPVGD